jgi:hypothetical protein
MEKKIPDPSSFFQLMGGIQLLTNETRIAEGAAENEEG